MHMHSTSKYCIFSIITCKPNSIQRAPLKYNIHLYVQTNHHHHHHHHDCVATINTVPTLSTHNFGSSCCCCCSTHTFIYIKNKSKQIEKIPLLLHHREHTYFTIIVSYCCIRQTLHCLCIICSHRFYLTIRTYYRIKFHISIPSSTMLFV